MSRTDGLLRGASVLPVCEREGSVRLLWARRNDDAPALAGFHVGPGGLLEEADAAAPSDHPGDAPRAAALRELFEEVGILHADGCDELAEDDRDALREALGVDAREGLERFRALGLSWRTRDLVPIGRWVTPSHAARRFDASFFALRLPSPIEPDPSPLELAEAEWITPDDGLARWGRAGVLLAPPLAAFLRSLARHGHLVAEELRQVFGAAGEEALRWEVVPHLQMLPFRTPTLPPATHTNSYLIGSGQALLVEPATPYPDEQAKVLAWVEEAARHDLELTALFLTHHHHDHVGGAQALREALGVPVWAHRLTAERLAGQVPIDRHIEDGERIVLDGPTPVVLRALHTPGHAPGHLCLLEERSGAMIVGDMVASVGTILVEPTDGDMALYLASLERMRTENATLLLPAHGFPIRDADGHLAHYIAHRLEREAKVRVALGRFGSPAAPMDLVPDAYDDVPRLVWPLAAMSTEAHLLKLEQDGRARRVEGRWVAV